MIFLQKIQKEKLSFFLDWLTLKYGADGLSRNVSKNLPLHAA